MRKGSAALVPLLLAIMLLFWFIAFMGGESDNLHKTSNLINLNNLQDKLLISAMNKRYDLATDEQDLYSEIDEKKKKALDKKISDIVHAIMKKNKIDD